MAREESPAPTVSRQAVLEAARAIEGRVRNTPIIETVGADFGLDEIDRIAFKLEFMQHAGSFKSRGAFNSLLTRTVPPAGVVAASGGNHGAAVAFAAKALGVPAKIFVPSVTSPAKLEQLRAYGAEVGINGKTYADALEASLAWERDSGALPVHAFDQVETVAGGGTLGIELLDHRPGVDTWLVAVGGGGLIAGVAAWFQGEARLIAVEPELAPTLTSALAAGEPTDAPAGGIAVDSLAPKRVGRITFPIIQRFVESAILVTDDEIREAQRALWRVLRIVTEPGGAAAFAAILARRFRPDRGESVGVVLCGANTILENFSQARPT